MWVSYDDIYPTAWHTAMHISAYIISHSQIAVSASFSLESSPLNLHHFLRVLLFAESCTGWLTPWFKTALLQWLKNKYWGIFLQTTILRLCDTTNTSYIRFPMGDNSVSGHLIPLPFSHLTKMALVLQVHYVLAVCVVSCGDALRWVSGPVY